MNFMLENVAADKTDSIGKADGRQAKSDIWREVLETMINPASGMDETERANYEQKIIQKLKSGKRLTSEELDYLRIHNPEMYRIAARVERERKVLESKLNNCKSKEEVQQVISVQMEALKEMRGDAAQEYMMAMVEKVVQDFKRTSEYARLPQKRGEETAEGGSYKKDDSGIRKEGEFCQRAVAYGRLRVQCDKIRSLAQPYLSA